jgi:zinc protease
MQQLKSFDQDGSVTKAVLKNDLTVLVCEAHAAPLVEVLAWVKVGYRDDPADLAGISRVMEHMLWRGTATRTAAAMAADIQASGGEFSGTAAYDHTSIRAVVPAAQWKRALAIQADAVLNAVLDPQELKRQAEVIAYESQRDLADPESLADAKLLEMGFAGERMGRGRSPDAEALSKITREKLLAFYQSSYRPARIVLVVCGDILTSDVLSAAVDLYGKARGGSAGESRAPAGDFQERFRYAQIRGNDRLARLALGFRTVPVNSADYPALEVLRAMLGSGEGAILNRRLKHQKGLILGAAADQAVFADTGYLRLRLELEPRDLDRCEVAVFTELEILRRQQADHAELERARAQVEREFWESLQTVSARAERLARFESLGSWKIANGYLARVEQVKWADIVRVAAKYLRLDDCAWLECLPADAEARHLSAETILGTVKDLVAPAAARELAERQRVTVSALETPAEAGSFKPSEVRYPFQTASILRGPDLFIREDHTMPLIHIGFFFPGGKLMETRANAGITSLMLRAMLRDSKTKSADQIYRQLEIYGGALVPVVEDDYFGFYFSVPSSNVERGLELVGEMIKSPKLDAEEIGRQKRIQSGALLGQTSGEAARHRLREALFDDYSYALDSNGTESSLAAITPEAVQAWFKAVVADKKPVVVIVGDTEGTNLAGYFVHNFSGSRFGDVKIPEGFPKPLENKAAIEAVGDAASSSVLMSFQAVPEGDEDSFPLIVLQDYAPVLRNRIQDALPGAFRVSLVYEPELRSGSVTACVVSAPEGEERALDLLSSELQRLANTPIPYRDYRAAVNAATGRFMIRQQYRFCQIADVMKSVLAGNGIAGFQDYLARLQDVKQTDLQEVARRVFKIEKSVTLRLHGKFAP